MKMFLAVCTILVATLVFATPSPAAIIAFDLFGNGGTGLKRLSEAPSIPATGGSGGEVGAGITFDDATNILTINIGWGTGNGFTDLTSTITGAHVHVPTPSLPPASFNEANSVLVGFNTLAGFNSSLTNGGFSGTVAIPSANVTGLLEGRSYINVHTNINPGGEIRGNLLPVPEPSTGCLVALSTAVLALRRRK